MPVPNVATFRQLITILEQQSHTSFLCFHFCHVHLICFANISHGIQQDECDVVALVLATRTRTSSVFDAVLIQCDLHKHTLALHVGDSNVA